MEIEKQAFSGLMEYYKLLPLKDKRNEIINELEEIISDYTKICTQFGVMPNLQLNKEMLSINNEDLTEEDYLHAVFAYVNTLQDISAQFINKMCDVLESKN